MSHLERLLAALEEWMTALRKYPEPPAQVLNERDLTGFLVMCGLATAGELLGASREGLLQAVEEQCRRCIGELGERASSS